MKNMYGVTRPAWAATERVETVAILIGAVALVLFSEVAEGLRIFLRVDEHPLIDLIVRYGWPIFETVALTFGCLALISWYKRQRVGCYPSTFIYCFNMPEESNRRGKSQVVGYCHIKPAMESGEITVEGASFFWEDGLLNIDSRVGFKSTQVHATKESEEIICHIRFSINQEDSAKRSYHHGLLQFQLANATRATGTKEDDVYAGYLRSTQKDADVHDVEVKSKGLAEWCSIGNRVEADIQPILTNRGDALFDRLDELLSTKPLPSLWRAVNRPYTNVWKRQIPTPQEIILNQQLQPYIDGFLGKVLALSGLDTPAIERFKRRARTKARLAIDTPAYEEELKKGLVGLTQEWRKYDALTDRANIICKQISPFLKGDSLLDIGCGNGLIAYLVKDRFKAGIQLVDVVQYVPDALGLPFRLYEEGRPLPINSLFDTVLLLTVLHHSENPIKLLKSAWDVTEKKLIIIESVVGVHKEEPQAKYELLNSSDEDQVAFAAFVDWFYNRVLHNDVPVPYNFTTPEQWRSIFSENNMHLAQTIHFGQDIDMGPEYHILFVLEKESVAQAEPQRLAS
jgi:SAM-dependent methyltransferase